MVMGTVWQGGGVGVFATIAGSAQCPEHNEHVLFFEWLGCHPSAFAIEFVVGAEKAVAQNSAAKQVMKNMRMWVHYVFIFEQYYTHYW